MTGKDIRFSRLFSGGKNAVVVAVDHGEFDGPLPGMLDLPETVRNIDPSVSAVLVSPGMLPHCGEAFSVKGAPLAMVRLNWSTVYAFHWGYNDADTVVAMTAEDAIKNGADLALVSLTLKTGSEARDAANVEVFCKLAAEAKRFGILPAFQTRICSNMCIVLAAFLQNWVQTASRLFIPITSKK